jgi:cobalt/nickel transport system ATP-binding protein
LFSHRGRVRSLDGGDGLKAIETINLTYTYPDGTKALENVNFTVEKSENIAILGPNGAGKSTLLHHLNGLLMPTSGKVYVLEKEVTKQNLDEIRQKVGLVFQDPDDQLFARTVNQDVAFGPTNLGLPKNEIEERVKWALDVTELKGLENKAPQNLSTGQKKRAAIAGVLAMKPEIMILDEPMANLDPRTASKILKLLLQLNQELGITLIIATHDVDLVPLFANQICIMSKGQIVLKGPPEEVFSKTDIIRSMDLRLPRITHLFEILSKRNSLSTNKHYPLTIGEARREMLRLLDSANEAESTKAATHERS